MKEEEKKLLKENKKKIKQEKKKMDKMRLATRIIAGMMVALMLFGICGTFIYYIIRMI